MARRTPSVRFMIKSATVLAATLGSAFVAERLEFEPDIAPYEMPKYLDFDYALPNCVGNLLSQPVLMIKLEEYSDRPAAQIAIDACLRDGFQPKASETRLLAIITSVPE